MMKLAISKNNDAASFTAMESGDDPLRMIAAIGSTEAEAAARLLEYHATLIRDGSIRLDEIRASAKG